MRQLALSLPTLPRLISVSGEKRWLLSVPPLVIQPVVGGAESSAAYVEIRSIGGLNSAVNRQLSERLCALLKEQLGIPPDRVYIGFTNVSAENWGWNGGTFG